MRVVFIGAGEYTVTSARYLIDWGHEVVIIESDPEKIKKLADDLDCGFLEGDGGDPAILKEAGPDLTDILFCLTDNDQANIIASLVGRTLGFKRVITSLMNVEYEKVCHELGLNDIIIPARTISRYLADITRGVDVLELSTLIRGNARLFSFTAGPDDSGLVGDLSLPDDAKVICLYRKKEFMLTDHQTKIRQGDEVVILTQSENMKNLAERWPAETANNNEQSD